MYLYPMSGTVRQQKVGRLILKELSDLFQRDHHGIIDNTLISILEVRMSPDLSVAKIYLGMTLAKNKEAVLQKINLRKAELRKALGSRIRNQVRIIPELVFILDEVEERAHRIDELLKNLSIPPASSEDH